MSTSSALRAPTPPMSGSATRNPNMARLGTVCAMLAKASSAAPSLGRRAATVATSVSSRCCATAPSISARWAIQKLISVTGDDRYRRHGVKKHPDPRIARAGDRLRRVERDEASLVKDAEPGGERKRFTHVVRHHDDGFVEPFLNAAELAM